MKKILWNEIVNFNLGHLSGIATRSVATQCDFLEKKFKSQIKSPQKNCITSSNEGSIQDQNEQQMPPEITIHEDLERIFTACKEQIEAKAQLTARIRHMDWLRKGQSIEDAINECFHGNDKMDIIR